MKFKELINHSLLIEFCTNDYRITVLCREEGGEWVQVHEYTLDSPCDVDGFVAELRNTLTNRRDTISRDQMRLGQQSAAIHAALKDMEANPVPKPNYFNPLGTGDDDV